MITLVKLLVLVVCFATMVGCSTTTSFKLPKDTQVRIDDRDETFKSGKAEMRPFFWNAFDGVKYNIIKANKTTRSGKLPSEFRVVSIFWPPYAFLYWPMGLKYSCYDLTDADEVKHCDPEDLLKTTHAQPAAQAVAAQPVTKPVDHQSVTQPVAQPAAQPVARSVTQPVEKKSESSIAHQNTPPSAASMVVIESKAKLRKSPSAKAVVIKTLKKGEEVQVIKQKDGWCLVELAGGETGWCLRSSLAQVN